MLDSTMIMDVTLLPGLAIALLAGFLSFLSPCVLPVVPPYLAYMGGVSVTDMDETTAARRKVLGAAAMFVLGLSTVFLILGYGSSALGRLFLTYTDPRLLVQLAGLVVMIFGAHFVGVFRIGFLDQEARLEAGKGGGSAIGAYVLGLAFALGWTPCIGPILGSILTIAGTQGDVTRGSLLLLFYAFGLGIPFLLVAAFFPRLKGLMNWMKRHMTRIERISGLLLWTVGLMMITGQFTDFSFWLLEQFPALATIG